MLPQALGDWLEVLRFDSLDKESVYGTHNRPDLP